MNINILILNLLNTGEIYNASPNASRSVPFFKNHPETIPIFLNNLDRPLSIIYNDLLIKGIVNTRGNPYSTIYISIFRTFVKDVIKYLESSKVNANKKNNIKINDKKK